MYHYRTDSPLSYASITPSATPELCGLSPAPRPKLRIAPGGLPYDENISPHHRQQYPHPQHASTNTPSTAGGSTSSRTTFWSAVGSVDTDDEEDCDFKPGSKADSGILVSPILPPSPSSLRESTSSGSTATPSSHPRGTRKSHPRSMQSSRQNSTKKPRQPSRQSTSTSTWTSSTASTAVPKLSRTNTDSTLRSLPRAHTKASRTEIATSLQQKYPNDRCHGAFLPFRSEFSHSKDSLCPVTFVPSNGSGAVPTTPISPRPAPASVAAEAYNGPVMYNTPIDWKGNAARRREYAAADRKRRGWRRWCCGMFGRGGDKVFWDGDDGGSVRRYRLDLPPESPEEEETVVEKLRIEGPTVVVQRGVGMKIEREREAEGWTEKREREKRERERMAS